MGFSEKDTGTVISEEAIDTFYDINGNEKNDETTEEIKLELKNFEELVKLGVNLLPNEVKYHNWLKEKVSVLNNVGKNKVKSVSSIKNTGINERNNLKLECEEGENGEQVCKIIEDKGYTKQVDVKDASELLNNLEYNINETNFDEVMKKDFAVVVVSDLISCKACKKLDPKIKNIEKNKMGGVFVGTISGESNNGYGILRDNIGKFSVPQISIFKNGKFVGTIDSSYSEDKIKNEILEFKK